MIFSPFMLL